jgi:hypothetical protein
VARWMLHRPACTRPHDSDAQKPTEEPFGSVRPSPKCMDRWRAGAVNHSGFDATMGRSGRAESWCRGSSGLEMDCFRFVLYQLCPLGHVPWSVKHPRCQRTVENKSSGEMSLFLLVGASWTNLDIEQAIQAWFA